LERKVQKILERQQTLEGAGVKLKRVLGNDQDSALDPFLLLDHFGSDTPEDCIKGFPWHPPREIGSRNGSRFLFASGEPLKEPVAWRGPIVMNTQEELDKAFKEFDMGTFIKTKRPVQQS
jgi:redox-sensitive bicupin YhaK (pirin superfamily)